MLGVPVAPEADRANQRAEDVHSGPELVAEYAQLRVDCEAGGHALAQKAHTATAGSPPLRSDKGFRSSLPAPLRAKNTVELEQTNLVIRLREGARGCAYWDAQWRNRSDPRGPWRLKKRRLGLVWQERDDASGWRKRRGRTPEGWLDERAANLAAVAAMAEQGSELAEEAELGRRVANALKTVRALAHDWLSWLDEVWGAKPATIKDYSFLLREPGEPFKRGSATTAGRIMAVFGDRPAAEVTTKDVSAFLRSLDREGLSPRNVNKHREVLAANVRLRLPERHVWASGESGRRDRQAAPAATHHARLLRGR